MQQWEHNTGRRQHLQGKAPLRTSQARKSQKSLPFQQPSAWTSF